LELRQKLLEESNRKVLMESQLRSETEIAVKSLQMQLETLQRRYNDSLEQIAELNGFKDRYSTKMQEAIAQYKIDLNREHANILSSAEVDKARIESKSFKHSNQNLISFYISGEDSSARKNKDCRAYDATGTRIYQRSGDPSNDIKRNKGSTCTCFKRKRRRIVYGERIEITSIHIFNILCLSCFSDKMLGEHPDDSHRARI
jgi:hypothetical protein